MSAAAFFSFAGSHNHLVQVTSHEVPRILELGLWSFFPSFSAIGGDKTR
jgi:hypothetical protein